MPAKKRTTGKTATRAQSPPLPPPLRVSARLAAAADPPLPTPPASTSPDDDGYPRASRPTKTTYYYSIIAVLTFLLAMLARFIYQPTTTTTTTTTTTLSPLHAEFCALTTLSARLSLDKTPQSLYAILSPDRHADSRSLLDSGSTRRQLTAAFTARLGDFPCRGQTHAGRDDSGAVFRDATAGLCEEMGLVSLAYEMLMDEEARGEYDAWWEGIHPEGGSGRLGMGRLEVRCRGGE
jgi:hypothetical protein